MKIAVDVDSDANLGLMDAVRQLRMKFEKLRRYLMQWQNRHYINLIIFRKQFERRKEVEKRSWQNGMRCFWRKFNQTYSKIPLHTL